ncbi:hypothetical protein GCM10028805_25880 [Spirosoma harenae]
MTTEQSYAGRGNNANPNPRTAKTTAKSFSPADNRYAPICFNEQDPSIISFRCEFGDLMQDPKAINRIRQDIRAWFTAYLPSWEQSTTNPNTCEESAQNFNALDNFLGFVIDAGIDRMVKEGQSHE